MTDAQKVAERTSSRRCVESPSARQVCACFIPCDQQNPYQRELAANLKEHGVRVSPWSSLKGLVPRVVRGVDAPDVVHLHWLPRPQATFTGGLRLVAFVLRLLVLRLLGRRIVWTAHNLYSHEASWRRGERWLARRVIALASRVIAHSETARRLVIEEFRVRRVEAIAVVPHGNYEGCYPNSVSMKEARDRLGLNPADVVFLFIGNLRPYKGVHELIAAFQELSPTGASLVIAGRPLNQATAVEIERSIAGNGRIRLHARFIPDDEVQVFLNACDVVVFPYRDILTSGAVILAMSFGRACIAPAVGCITDVLDRRGAFLYDPDRREGLREALTLAVANRDRLKEMGAHNLERAREWSWDRVAGQTAGVYRDALA